MNSTSAVAENTIEFLLFRKDRVEKEYHGKFVQKVPCFSLLLMLLGFLGFYLEICGLDKV